MHTVRDDGGCLMIDVKFLGGELYDGGERSLLGHGDDTIRQLLITR